MAHKPKKRTAASSPGPVVPPSAASAQTRNEDDDMSGYRLPDFYTFTKDFLDTVTADRPPSPRVAINTVSRCLSYTIVGTSAVIGAITPVVAHRIFQQTQIAHADASLALYRGSKQDTIYITDPKTLVTTPQATTTAIHEMTAARDALTGVSATDVLMFTVAPVVVGAIGAIAGAVLNNFVEKPRQALAKKIYNAQTLVAKTCDRVHDALPAWATDKPPTPGHR